MRALLLLAALALPGFGCDCMPMSACQLIQRSDSFPALFIGEVIDGGIDRLQMDPWYADVNHVRFKVLESFRGLPPNTGTVDVEIGPSFGMCSPIPYFSGRRYLVVPSILNGKFHDGVCSSARDVEKYPDDIAEVRAYFSGKPSRKVSGRIAAETEQSLVDFVLTQGEAKPLRGVTVSTTIAGKLVSAVSDAAGRYTLWLPAPGRFQLTAALAPYTSISATASVQGRGCAVQNFGLSIDNTISGTVVDRQRQPIKHAEVGLIDLDEPHSAQDRHVWFNSAYVEEKDQTFLLKNVPIGRYRLAFNPDGPAKGSLFDLALESTYYPSVIEIRNSGTHLKAINLIAGPPVAMRQVTVRARFSDGSVMQTAQIHCTGDPLRPGEFPWIGTRVPGKVNTGEHFFAPVNRRLTIQLTDLYGRDLRGVYTAIFEPGATPIVREFVVNL